MSFWRCYYHIVWATKDRQPLLSPEIERVVIQAATEKSHSLKCSIHAMNGVADHMHVAVCIPPYIAVADWVRNIKGMSAHTVNEVFPDRDIRFQWQRGYGVLTFGAKLLPVVSDYIARQKEHHQQNTIEAYLERTDEDAAG
ncbi:MAG: IS200/IS605 family transposase [Anaerolineae bacterium]|nr:IS200/IS605 family transposase [Anaerolineae bacterium]